MGDIHTTIVYGKSHIYYSGGNPHYSFSFCSPIHVDLCIIILYSKNVNSHDF